ncbi:MAG: hypothetical protein HKN72_03280 [Gemmatimonadetes bacterium]|nr:hypothetical protein [Gemmatimonadota bacterium]NNF12218.1 hypothetical protein [Gemmatimonadota bacterium]NNK62834.1 hypothetical protein [Gemmatimonadota bacterium]
MGDTAAASDVARRVGAVLVSFLAVTAAISLAPIQDAVSGGPVGFAEQTRPIAYLLGAPLFGIWDSLSLLSLSQHYAVLATLVALYLGSVSRARRWTVPGRSLRAWAVREAGRAGSALLLLVTFYAAGVVLPRPMTGIRLSEPDLVAIDFHSHTHYSHDGWSLFSAARNREWHEGGGFDVAYVTDHYTWAGVDEAARDNPQRVGERTVLISGAEIRIHRRPTNILGDRSRYLGALDADSVYMDPELLADEARRSGRPPTLLYTMPGGLEWVLPFTADLPSGMIGIEINDGSPRGLEQVRSQRREIIALADSMDLALIGAANLHGWGRTVASWSIMEIPGWQEMTPEGVGDAIEATLHRERRAAVQVLERRMPYHDGSPLLVVTSLPWLTMEHFRMLSLDERASWLLWIAVVVAGMTLRDRRRDLRA